MSDELFKEAFELAFKGSLFIVGADNCAPSTNGAAL